MQGVNCYLELWEYTSPTPIGQPAMLGANDYGYRHLAFEVDDVHLELERLQRLGGKVMNTPVKYPHGSNAIYARDPFGNIVELMEAGPNFPTLCDLMPARAPV